MDMPFISSGIHGTVILIFNLKHISVFCSLSNSQNGLLHQKASGIMSFDRMNSGNTITAIFSSSQVLINSVELVGLINSVELVGCHC